MDNTKPAEVATANFKLNRLLLEMQRTQTASALTSMEFQIAVQSTKLALTRYQQARISLILEVQQRT